MRARERLLHLVFNDLTSLYLIERENLFPALCFDNVDEAQRIIDDLILRYVRDWPVQAKRELGFVLGASLVHHRGQLIGSVTPSRWGQFPDPADALYGHVFWSLFPGRELEEFVNRSIVWDTGPVDDLSPVDNPLQMHDWSEFRTD